MRERILLDTGPLVALLNPDDARHDAAVAGLKSMRDPFHSCLPVISEAYWLLRKRHEALQYLMELCADGTIQLCALGNEDFKSIAAIRNEYAPYRPDFADAALVQVARRERLRNIATFDYRDFSIYRSFDGSPFDIIR